MPLLFAHGRRGPTRAEILQRPPPRPHWGPALWERLHRGARTARTPAERLTLVAEITAALPRQACGCLGHWRQLLAAHPPRVRTAAAFFAWTVQRHNDVRRRKQQPEFSFAAAVALYPSAVD